MLTTFQKNRSLTTATLLAIAQFATTSAVTLSEGSFATWAGVAHPPFPAQTTTVQGAGGNPGAYLQVQTTSNDIQVTENYGSTLVYDPASGAIVSLDFSVDINEFNTFGEGMAYGLLAIQGGTVYFGPTQITQGIGNTWTTTTQSGLTSADLLDPFAQSPDFSTAGAPITFGLYTANGGGNGITVGYDNVTIELATQVPNNIPDAGATAALLGFGLVGLLAVSRKK